MSCISSLLPCFNATGYALGTQSFFYTGMNGPQVQVDIEHTQHWSITPQWNISDFYGGRFALKAGPQTTANIGFLFFQGTYNDYLEDNYVSLIDVIFPPSHIGFADFTEIDFFLDAPLELGMDNTYTGVLYSNAPTPQSRAYFIKNDFAFVTPPNPAVIPLPSALPLCAVGLGMIGMGGRRRRK